MGAAFFTVFFAAFFATMAAAPSHMVILLANRAGTINRLQPRGNGARRPLASPVSGRGARLPPLFPAPRPVIRPRVPPGSACTPSRHSGHAPAPPVNRSAVARTGPYTGLSERHRRDE
ncbi:hypothetical protein F2B00_11640 [Streptomyces parvus]|nr:hypothetical protein F2B00_11640 [Streptomyces parvus]